MATSTSTTIDVVNKVLHNVGERRVRVINTPVATLAFDSVVEALREMELIDDWEFLRVYLTPVDGVWTNERFTHDLQRIRAVSYGNTTDGYRPLTFLDREQFDQKPLSTDGEPIWYSLSDERTIAINPYSTLSAERAKIRVYGTAKLVVPTLITDTFNISEDAITVLVKLASSIMAQRHMANSQLANQFRYDFETLAQRYRVQRQTSPVGGFNMWRGNRRYGF